jgi:hypothetical protein
MTEFSVISILSRIESNVHNNFHVVEYFFQGGQRVYSGDHVKASKKNLQIENNSVPGMDGQMLLLPGMSPH